MRSRIKQFLTKHLKTIRAKAFRRGFDYIDYWSSRYQEGGDSGEGSYGILAEFKAEVINAFIKKHAVESVVEFGCGDGNQLKYMNYGKYLGLDVAKNSIERCCALFENDHTKSFMIYNPKYFVNNNFIRGDMVVCLDVLYHIIPEDDFMKTLQDIFSCSSRYVILYTTLRAYRSHPYEAGSHICHRDTLSYLSRIDQFEVKEIVDQQFHELSVADFVILARKPKERRNDGEKEGFCCENINSDKQRPQAGNEHRL